MCNLPMSKNQSSSTRPVQNKRSAESQIQRQHEKKVCKVESTYENQVHLPLRFYHEDDQTESIKRNLLSQSSSQALLGALHQEFSSTVIFLQDCIFSFNADVCSVVAGYLGKYVIGVYLDVTSLHQVLADSKAEYDEMSRTLPVWVLEQHRASIGRPPRFGFECPPSLMAELSKSKTSYGLDPAELKKYAAPHSPEIDQQQGERILAQLKSTFLGQTRTRLFRHQLHSLIWAISVEELVVADTGLPCPDTQEIQFNCEDANGWELDPLSSQIVLKGFRPQRTSKCLRFRGGYIAHDVGLGKSLTVLSLMVCNPRLEETKIDKYMKKIHVKATLIIAPSHLVQQWEGEVMKHFPGHLTIYLSPLSL